MWYTYFSHSGNTRTVAEQITRSTGADLFEIQPQEAYPTDYHSVVDQAKKEINTNHRPALKNDVQDFDKYDIIFVGSPNWWSTIAPPVATFLERHDFSGKTIVPFMTHGGGRFGHSISDMKKLCPDASFSEGLAIRDSYVNDNRQDVVKWLQTLKLLK